MVVILQGVSDIKVLRQLWQCKLFDSTIYIARYTQDYTTASHSKCKISKSLFTAMHLVTYYSTNHNIFKLGLHLTHRKNRL
jgi:hypothetical protein